MKLESVVRAEDLFESLGREEKTEERVIKVKRTKDFDKLLRGLEYIAKLDLNIDVFDEDGDFTGGYYNVSLPLLDLLEVKNIRACDVMNLSLHLKRFEEHCDFPYKCGSYLSACINKSNNKRFKVITSHLEEKPCFVGAFNKGSIIEIDGGAWDHVGYGMESGKIIVNGNVEDFLGDNVLGGEIVVNGNARAYIGQDCRGTIRLNGDYNTISRELGDCNIYHKNKLIIKNGEKVE